MSSRTTSQPGKQLLSIQALRGIAALLVAFHHVCLSFAENGQRHSLIVNNPGLRDFGACGVDMFFVISGFIMVVVTASKPPEQRSTGVFFAHRFIRIAPLYWIYSTCFLVLILNPYTFANMRSHYNWPYIFKSYLLIPVTNYQGAMRPMLAQGWTLIYEMFFYLIFSLFLRFKTVSSVVGICLTMTTFVCCGLIFQPSNEFLKGYSDPIILEFCFGTLAGLMYTSKRLLPPLWAWSLLALSALGFLATIAIGVSLHENQPYRVLFWGIPSFGLIASLSLLEKHGLLSRWSPWLLFIGDSSYSIYLAHHFPLLVANVALRRIPLPFGLSDMAVFVLVVVCVIPGLISYLFVEKPMTSHLNKLIARRRT